ncbi:unnamed protein product [Boreogadus saida]
MPALSHLAVAVGCCNCGLATPKTKSKRKQASTAQSASKSILQKYKNAQLDIDNSAITATETPSGSTETPSGSTETPSGSTETPCGKRCAEALRQMQAMVTEMRGIRQEILGARAEMLVRSAAPSVEQARRCQPPIAANTAKPSTNEDESASNDSVVRPLPEARKVFPEAAEADIRRFMREKLSNAAKILRRKEKLSKFYDAVAKHMIQSQPDRATTPCTMLKQAAGSLQEVTNSINQLSQLAKSQKEEIMANVGLQPLKEAFACLVCKAVMADPMFATCCESIIGCRTCVELWLVTSDHCLKCRAGDFENKIHEVKGLSAALSLFKERIIE